MFSVTAHMHEQQLLGIEQDRMTLAALESHVAQGRVNSGTEMSKLSAVTQAEQWAAEHRQFLQALLNDPSHDHGAGALLPPNQILVAHVVGLVNELSTSNRKGNPWKHYQGRLKGGAYVALHTWLYHLGGGANGKLIAPSVRDACRDVVQPIEAEINVHKQMRWEASSKQSRRLPSHDTVMVDAELDKLYEIALQPFDWRLLRARGAPPADPPPPPPTDAERSTAERDLRWLIACGASDPNSRL